MYRIRLRLIALLLVCIWQLGGIIYVEASGDVLLEDDFGDASLGPWRFGGESANCVWAEDNGRMYLQVGHGSECDFDLHYAEYDTTLGSADAWCEVELSKGAAGGSETFVGIMARSDNGATPVWMKVSHHTNSWQAGSTLKVESHSGVSFTASIADAVSCGSMSDGDFITYKITGTGSGFEVKVWDHGGTDPGDCDEGDADCGYSTPTCTIDSGTANFVAGNVVDTGDDWGVFHRSAGVEVGDNSGVHQWRCNDL